MSQSLPELEQDLMVWGLIEHAPSGVTLTRRLRGALARAAASLQAEEERGKPGTSGHPLQLALARALEDIPLPAGAGLTDGHLRFLFAVEWASLPVAVREALAQP